MKRLKRERERRGERGLIRHGRVIAMGLPGETIDKVWRNDADAVAEFFNTYHK